MNGVEFVVIECLKQKKWENALYHLNQLLENGDCRNTMEQEKQLAYLLWRSQCYFELQNHEACVKDCRKIMTFVPDEAPRNNFWFKSRWRLVHSLIQLKAFNEAREIVQQLIQLCTDFTKQECVKLLERIRIGSQLVNGDGDVGSNNQSMLVFDANSSAFSSILSNNDVKKENTKKSGSLNSRETKTYSCIFCNVVYNTVEEFRAHCSTQNHQQIIMSDEGRDWKKRPPPRGLTADTYNLCAAYGSNAIGVCPNGAQCVDAHGVEELNEWKERFEYRMMKLHRSNEAMLYGKSYTELLLNKLAETSNPETIVRESLDDVEEQIEGNLTTIFDSKISNKKWTFTFRTTKLLKVVALLYDSHRSHFSLSRITTSKGKKTLLDDVPINTQEWTSRLDLEDDRQQLEHEVEITFATKLYGTFRQTVIFDFGAEPYLSKHLCVDVVPVNDAEKMKEMQQELVLSSTERWEANNAIIIPFTSSVIDFSFTEKEQELLSKYYVPTGHKFTITQSMLNDDCVTKNNYRSRMHELLYIEEMACYDQVAKYSVRANIQVVSSYILSSNVMGASTAKFSIGGELFAMITLTEDVSEDSPGGRLVLNNCTTVLLADGKKVRRSDSNHKLKVYEAVIEDKGKNVVYLRLSSITVSDLKLKADTSVTLEMQFQLNRIPFCEWHQAVDCVSDYRIIFPDILNIPEISKITDTEWMTDDAKLNEKQREAIVAITVSNSIPLPPVLIIGPFGTGKTYTLARAVKHILVEKNTRILICTHSNSAADLYIKEYLHSYVQSGLTEATPLRIYYHKRWVSTVNSTVLEYCLTEVVNGTRIFKIPQLEDLLKYRIIVVTLNIASHLSSIGLPKGHFTHILLDEAAQAIECEAIMPLALANEKTRIVLAGDHMQLSPEIFSSFAKQKKFHVSLLQRLYESYPNDFPCKIVLCENYRAHKAIVQFTSSLFYDSKLLSLGEQPRHKKFYPLTFFTALGEDVQEKNSTGFYNCAEVYELVERVAELKRDWPECWGKFNEHSIGIMTPYPDQVYRIRIELKKRKMMGISVERVLNVQGKQFRAVFLSTVRTARTCDTDEIDTEDSSPLYDYGFLSNKKLLNTAVTRAQSLVAIVGDPVSLCSIGRCRKIWENFLEICCKNNSLFGLTWQDLKSLLLAVELKKKYKLNPLAPEFVPRCLQMEPYLQFLGAPLQRTAPFNAQQAGMPMPSGYNVAHGGRIYTYDNIRYHLPAAKSVVAQPAPPPPMMAHPSSIVQQPPPLLPKWTQPPPQQQPQPPPPQTSPLNAAASVNVAAAVNSVALKTPAGAAAAPLRTPPGFPPLQMPSNSFLYQTTTAAAQAPQTFSNVLPLQQPPPPTLQTPAISPYLTTTTTVRSSVSPDTSIPLQLTLIPLSQYMRSQMSSSYPALPGTKTFNPPIVNLGNAVCAPTIALPNGYKANVMSNVYVPNTQNTTASSMKYPSSSAAAAAAQEYASYNTATTSQTVNATSSNVGVGISQDEIDLKNALPPNIPLSEMLKNTTLQKQWLSHLMDSKQLHSAQIFLNIIRAHSKDTQKENIINAGQKLTRRVESGLEYIGSRDSAQNSQMNHSNNGRIDAKDYDISDDHITIPPNVHLPSSLLPDLLPLSGSKRRGPLYEREPSAGSSSPQLNGSSSAGSNVSNAAAYQIDSRGYDTLAYSSDARMNYDRIRNVGLDPNYELSTKLSETLRIPSSSSATSTSMMLGAPLIEHGSLDQRCDKALSNSWNLMSNSYSNGVGGVDANEFINSGSTMTYAAALRQSQQKLFDVRETNTKQTF